jgi:hypothetical protein
MSPALRAVRPGDRYSPAVTGGVRATAVPSAGAVVDMSTEDVFIPAASLVQVLESLGYQVSPPVKGRTRR